MGAEHYGAERQEPVEAHAERSELCGAHLKAPSRRTCRRSPK